MSGKLPKLHKNFELEACCLMRYSFLFVTSILIRGFRKQLQEDDMYEPLPEHVSDVATRRMTEGWEKEKQKAAKANRKPSLAKVVLRLYAKRFSLYGILMFLESVCLLLQPIVMGILIRYFRYDSPIPKRDAYLAAGGVGLLGIMIPICHHPCFHGLMKLGLELKTACCGMIMEKGVRLNCGALHRTTVGHMINLLSNDVAVFEQTFLFPHFFWLVPLLLVAYIYLIWKEIGVSSLAGFLALFLLIPFHSYFTRQLGICREKIAVRSDKRINATSEILNGIRVIKMYVWEDASAKLIGDLRSDELITVRENSIWQALIVGTFWASGKLVILFAIICYLLTGHQLAAEPIFVATALYNSSLLPFGLYIPFAFQALFQARVSLARIQEFLELEEFEDIDSSLITDKADAGDDASDEANPEKVPLLSRREVINKSTEENVKVEMINYSAEWDVDEKNRSKDSSASVIRNITLSAKKGQLVIVAGPVGCGKSSLLLSILRETRRTDGVLRVNGRIAYASQQAWIFPGTVRDNILFGSPYDRDRYHQAIEICALKQDLLQLPHGDASSVGDRGESLSGGQKARISLARTVYQDADIYLLDDPLSAVDTVVGEHLFRRCIKQYLKSKAIILVTHQIQYLPKADMIALMLGGEIVASGSPEALKQTAIYKSVVQETERTYSTQLTNSSDAPSPSVTFSFSEQSDDMESTTGVNSSLRDLSSARLIISTSLTKTVGNMMRISNQEAEEVHLFDEEDRSRGDVPWRIYYLYIGAMAHPWFPAVLMILFAAVVQALANVTDWWLNKWTTASELAQKQYKEEAEQNLDHVEFVDRVDFGAFTVRETLTSYRNSFIIMTCAILVGSLLRSLWFRLTQVIASRVFHDSMLKSVIGTKVIFFDKNPTGPYVLDHLYLPTRLLRYVSTRPPQRPSRVIAVFLADTTWRDITLDVCKTGDVNCSTDFNFPHDLDVICKRHFHFFSTEGVLTFIGFIIVIVVINPILLAIATPLFLLFLFVRHVYLCTSRDVKRLEAITRSPVYSHISSVMYGLITVRAFHNQSYVVDRYHQFQEMNTAAEYLNLCTTRWFSAVIDWLVAIFLTAAAFFCIVSPLSLTGGEVGLILVYAMQLLSHFSWIIRESAEVQNGMVSVERIVAYCELPLEPISKGALPPSDWPTEGHIQFEDVSLRYAEGAPLVLKNISVDIAAKEKIGIVGRTGAGKTSLSKVLFRLVEPQGTIFIDNIDTKSIMLKMLRKRISIIPQDPVLFIGTLISNLDPFKEYEVEKVWKVLEEVELKKTISVLPSGLETPMQGGGVNFSVGQRQLICLARALLRESRIIVIDEATANVDPLTDSLIQKTIKEGFHESTVLTIAHRLNTIMDSDRVMVLQKGELIEFDRPYTLLEQTDSVFFSLAAETGEENLQNLKHIAAKANKKRKEKKTESDS